MDKCSANERNPYAFPAQTPDDEFSGMTLRDWFAGQALAGIMAKMSQAILDAAREQGVGPDVIIAQMAYEAADAMLTARREPSA